MRYSNKRLIEWSGPIAYSVGLMASDGCLQKDGRHLDLTSNDLGQLKNFMKALGKSIKISTKFNGSGQKSYRVQFSDVAYYDFLLSAGLTPAKSRSLSSLAVPTEYYADFLRGVFDGDGTTYGYFDTRWPSSFMFYVSICSASTGFLRYLQTTTHILAGTGQGSLRGSHRANILVYAKRDSRILYEFMYKSAGSLYLNRKRKKLESFIIQDQNGTITQSRASGGMVDTLV